MSNAGSNPDGTSAPRLLHAVESETASEPARRKCCCAGNCGQTSGPTPINREQVYVGGYTRREFIALVGAGTAATLAAGPALGAFELPADAWDRWRRELLGPAQPRRYFSDQHTDARMHLGGIGTGNFEIGADGQLTTWQLFNTLRDGHVPMHFLIKAGSTAKLLQTTGGPDWPRVKQIEMTGEYPLATLRFLDKELSVDLELTAFTPFAPLDSAFSAMPLAAFVFRVHNPTRHAQPVSLAAVLQNPVGYDAAGENNGLSHPAFGGNINQQFVEGNTSGIFMSAQAAAEPTLDTPVTICTLANLKPLQSPPSDCPANLKLEVTDGHPIVLQKLEDPSHTFVWLEEAGADMAEPYLRSVRDAVEAGATLVFSGRKMPLLEAYASWTGGKPVAEAQSRPDILFEDFENGYEKWRVEGEAFGKAPASGTLPNQQKVSGFVGRGLVNSFWGGDDTTGRLISKPFVIERRFIRFLVGGGQHALTQIRLLVDGKIFHAASGKDNEQLEPALWDVSALEGQTAHIEIVDEQKGGWGHINVDQIEFSDLPGQRAVMELLEELLPARFSAVQPADSPVGTPQFTGMVLQSGATQTAVAHPSMTDPKGTITLLEHRVGKGKAVIASGAVINPAHAGFSNHRQLAYAFLCGLVGARYPEAGGFQHPKSPGFGTLALAVLGSRASGSGAARQNSHSGVVSSDQTVLCATNILENLWKMFGESGRFGPTTKVQSFPPTELGQTIYGALASSVEVPAGKTVEIPFLLAWHYPNKYSPGKETAWMGCQYTTRWSDARAVIKDAAAQFSELRQRTEQFRDTMYSSTLPYWLLDCLSANAAIMRHIGVVFRIANGDVYGWEGSNGCCQPTCTHVWGYEQSLARLFPDLEKDMRRIDFKHQQRPDGGVNNRTHVPSPPHPTGEKPFADGHASCILKAYREALNHPNDGFLKEYWPHINRAVEYLIQRDAQSSGGQPTGILQDDQWNTYDEALHGVTTFIGTYYLAALRAGEEWARRTGDSAAAERFHGIFEKGQGKLMELCWNGEYFQQNLPDYMTRQGEFGPGCTSDQLIGQWWAHQLGLGYLLPQDKVVAALRAIFKHNFKSDLTGWKHAPRAFAGAKDKGLIICTWPKGGRPGNVMLYSDEVWTGIEYQVAAHMMYEGLIEEGLALVKAARDRYDGVPRPPIQRNPWNEIECGGHYARAMSSWSLLLALSGWHYDGPRQALGLRPRHTLENFRCLFTGPEGWGSLRQSRQGRMQTNEIRVVEGQLAAAELSLVPPAPPKRVRADCAGRSLAFTSHYDSDTLRIIFKEPTRLKAGQSLVIHVA